MQRQVQTDALKRLRIIEGHLRKVIEMVEAGEYCPDVIQQSSAVQNSLRKVDEILLEGHLEDCVRNAMKEGAGEKEIKEIMQAFRKR